MTMFKKCRGIHRERRLGSKMAWARIKEGDAGKLPRRKHTTFRTRR